MSLLSTSKEFIAVRKILYTNLIKLENGQKNHSELIGILLEKPITAFCIVKLSCISH